MSARPVIDAGPGLNFFALNKERLPISVLGQLSTPETVRNEILRKARTDKRFERAEAVVNKLTPTYLEVLPDDVTAELDRAVQRIERVPMSRRLAVSKDLGELMVIAHATVLADAGSHVVVLIDETNGAALAGSEQRRLARMRSTGASVGSIKIVNTPRVLAAAAGGPHIPDRATLRTLYNQMRKLDDGLVPIESTDLLAPNRWP
jgi:hypothetical protein